MRKTIVLFILFFFLSLGASFFSPVEAQNGEKLLLAVAHYKTREHLNFLFANSVRVLNYFEGEEIEEPVFISLIREDRRQKITQLGLRLKILDYDTDLLRYVMLFHFQPNQSAKLSSFGEVYPVTKYHTLLKLAPNTEFIHEGISAEFHRIPFPETIVSPPMKPKILTTPTPIILSPTEERASLTLWYFLIFTSFLLSFLATVFFQRKKRLTNKEAGLAFFLLFAGLIFMAGIFILQSKTEESRSKNDLELKNVEEF